MNSTHNNISLKELKAAKEILAEAIEGTAVLAGIFETIRDIAEEGVIPIDPVVMQECDAMVTALNRIMYEQDSRLKHIQTMRIAERKAAQLVARAKCRALGTTGKVSLTA